MHAPRKFLENFKGVSRNIEGCFSGVLSGLKGRLREVFRVFQGGLTLVSRKIEERSEKPLSKIQRSFNGI